MSAGRAFMPAIQNDGTRRFASRYQSLGLPSRWARVRIRRRNIFVIRTTSALCYIAVSKNEIGGRDVDLALKLNVLVVLAVFAFVGAILLGAL
jgi:hypothetical protein